MLELFDKEYIREYYCNCEKHIKYFNENDEYNLFDLGYDLAFEYCKYFNKVKSKYGKSIIIYCNNEYLREYGVYME